MISLQLLAWTNVTHAIPVSPLLTYSICHCFSSVWFIQIYKSFCLSALTFTSFSPFSQFSSVAQSCLTLWDPMDCSTPGFPVHHQLPEPTQTHVHRMGDAIQPSHHLSSPSPPAFNLSQHQGLFKGFSSLYQVAKVLEFQLQHQYCQWIFRTDFL